MVAKLHGEKPEDDGGKPITGYVLQKLDKATGRWMPVGKAPADATDFDVKGLSEGHDFSSELKLLMKKENLNHWRLKLQLLLKIHLVSMNLLI